MKRMKTGSALILGVLGTLGAAGMLAGFSTGDIVVQGTVDFKAQAQSPNVFACPENATCSITSSGVLWMTTGNYANDFTSRLVVVHADNGDDIQVFITDGAMVLEDGEHAVFTLLPKGKNGGYLLLKAHPIK